VENPKKYWVGFNHVKGIGAARQRALLDYFGDLEAAWKAPGQALRAAGLGGKIVENFLQVRSGIDLDLVWERIQKQGIQVISWDDETYPKRLKEIDQPPPVLYVLGTLEESDEWAVAIVGTRRITPYGRQVGEEVGLELARNGITVVSGLARGVDAVAHKAALNAGGRTLAVLGSGADQIYPPEHRGLADQIRAHGAILSDYAPGTPPDGVNFPPRNRIISGLSMAVVVIEAGEQSGALITAEFAAEQGRDVYAVPGSIHAPQSMGCLRLIQQGARPLLKAQEILEILDIQRIQQHQSARRSLPPADETEGRLLNLLGAEPRHVDELRLLVDMPIEKVTATLVMMELKGMVRQVGGMNYISVRDDGVEYQV
jgi:DNA processing protein